MVKKILASTMVLGALWLVTPVYAETVKCETSQYGSSVCGVETSTEVQVKHVDAGAGDMGQVLGLLGVISAGATYLYKKSYNWYILG